MGRRKKKKEGESLTRDWGILEYGLFLIFNLLLVYILSLIIRGELDWPLF